MREFALGKIFLNIGWIQLVKVVSHVQCCSGRIVISLCVHSPRLSSSHFCLYFETEITRSGIIDHGEDKLLVEQLNKVILVLINSGTCKFEC